VYWQHRLYKHGDFPANLCRQPTDTANSYFLNPIHQEPQTSSAHNLPVCTGISSGNFFVSKFHTGTLQYTPVPLAPRSEAKTLIACALRSWVRIPLEAWMFVLFFLCCAVQVEAFVTGWSLVQRSPTDCLHTTLQVRTRTLEPLMITMTMMMTINIYYIHLSFPFLWRYILVSLLINMPALKHFHFERC
jgi:hypothetical protein